jgi:predicted component of type VI protein secretion system
MNKFTRRELAAALSTSAVLLAQPQTQPLPATPDDELKTSRAQLRANADQLDKFPLPMTTEPATTFKP